MEKILKIVGLVLIVGGLLLVGLIYSPVIRQEVNYRITSVKAPFQKNKEVIPLDKDFGLVIPKIAVNTPDVFAGLTAIGIAILIIIESVMNISSMLGLIPLSGMPLLFVSHGGTALIITLGATGIIANISKHKQ